MRFSQDKRSDIQCSYCYKKGHVRDDCFSKKRIEGQNKRYNDGPRYKSPDGNSYSSGSRTSYRPQRNSHSPEKSPNRQSNTHSKANTNSIVEETGSVVIFNSNSFNGKLVTIEVLLEGHPVKGIIDSGSQISVITTEHFRKLGRPIDKYTGPKVYSP